MSLLFSLPDDLCRVLLTEWMSSLTVGYLDSSLCSSIWRQSFQSLLIGMNIRYVAGGGRDFYTWALNRNIYLAEIILDRDWSLMELLPMFRLDRILRFDVDLTGEFTSVVNMLVNVKILVCTINNVNFSNVKPSILEQLSTLSLSSSDALQVIPTFTAISRHCRNLSVLKFPTTTQFDCTEIFRSNPIRSLELQFSNESLRLMATLCFRTLTFVQAYGFFDFSTLAALLKLCVNLKRVTIGGAMHLMYSIADHKLEIEDFESDSQGWEEFSQEIRDLRVLDIYCEIPLDDFDFLTLSRNNAATLQTLLLTCQSIPFSQLSCLTWPSSQLTEVYFRADSLEEYKCAFENCFSLQRLELSMNFGEKVSVDLLVYFLENCETLTHFAVSDIHVSINDVRQLLPKIQGYRNNQNQSIQCTLRLGIGDGDSTWQLRYDGSKFSGDMWEEGLKDYYENDVKIAKLQSEVSELRGALEVAEQEKEVMQYQLSVLKQAVQDAIESRSVESLTAKHLL